MSDSAASLPSDIRVILAAPRYASQPFPPYRFTPGRDPHPAADPRGHSYEPPGHTRPSANHFAPQRWRECDEYLYGCDLYNHGYWWEAHEAWEDFWRVCPPDSAQKHFLQGLIQITACCLKLFLVSESARIDPLRDSLRSRIARSRETVEPMDSPDHLAGVRRLRATFSAHLQTAAKLIDASAPADLPRPNSESVNLNAAQYMGLNIDMTRTAAETYFDQALLRTPPSHDAATFPYLLPT